MTARVLVDARGLRVSAAVTCVLACAALVAGLLGASAFVLGASSLLALLMGSAVAGRPLLAPLQSRLGWVFGEKRLEPVEGPRFAQMCGIAVLSLAVFAWLAGWTVVFVALTAALVVLSGLLAVVDVCVGCLLYGVVVRSGSMPS